MLPPKLCSTSWRLLVLTVQSCEHAGISGCVNHPVHTRHRFQVAGVAKVGMEHSVADCPQGDAIRFTARADEIVQTTHLPIRTQ